MRAVLISIKPKWCELIASGKKTVEIRKTKPKLDTPFKCYIYCTKNGLPFYLNPPKININDRYLALGKVIGEFMCNEITDMRDMGGEEFFATSCMTYEDWRNYTDYTKHIISGWHISDLKIYDKPKELSEFLHFCPNDFGEKCAECEKFTYSDTGRACCDRRLSRPPQSWCYVEEATKNESI